MMAVEHRTGARLEGASTAPPSVYKAWRRVIPANGIALVVAVLCLLSPSCFFGPTGPMLSQHPVARYLLTVFHSPYQEEEDALPRQRAVVARRGPAPGHAQQARRARIAADSTSRR